jgi:nucleotide-binding universal stress UspA family protein
MQSENVDFMVIGTRGRSDIERMVLGNNEERPNLKTV